MPTYIRHVVAALTLIATSGAAQAQWVFTPETHTLIVREPLPLTQAQRTTIYRTIIPQGRGRGPIVREQIVTEPVAPPVAQAPVTGGGMTTDYYAYGYAPSPPRRAVREADAYAYAVGSRVAPGVRLAPLPRPVVTAVPEVRSYRYMVINNRLLLVDPATGIVVAEVTE